MKPRLPKPHYLKLRRGGAHTTKGKPYSRKLQQEVSYDGLENETKDRSRAGLHNQMEEDALLP
jgi:hypothetical protein